MKKALLSFLLCSLTRALHKQLLPYTLQQSTRTHSFFFYLLPHTQVTPDNQEDFAQQMRQYALASDCPIFDRMFEYCQMYCGGSIGE